MPEATGGGVKTNVVPTRKLPAIMVVMKGVESIKSR